MAGATSSQLSTISTALYYKPLPEAECLSRLHTLIF
jgi:hypothetical protein